MARKHVIYALSISTSLTCLDRRFSTRQGDPFCRAASGSNSNRLLEGPLQSVDHKAFHQAGFGAWPDLGTSVPSDDTGLRSACNSLTMSLLYIQIL